MTPQSKRWLIAPKITPQADLALGDRHYILKQILFNRGYATNEAAERYLAASKPPGTSPLNLKGMPEALARIRRALQKGETIAIYGDYDADGVTSTALLLSYFQALGVKTLKHIPNRFREGYGLKVEALDQLKAAGADLVITVDCGIRSLEEANHARHLGLDLIITDHHHPLDEMPDALAIIDPKQPGDSYPEKELAGVGLAYKLVEGLSNHPEGNNLPAEQFLDLVAIGTVADLAPLVGENRYFVRQGLLRLQKPTRQGIQSLMGVCELQPQSITASHIGFALGPRINAAGRLNSAYHALELLTTRDLGRAVFLAQYLQKANQERQKLTRAIEARAEELTLQQRKEALLLFAVHPDFNPGVVGLAASRLVEKYYRPAIIGHHGEEVTRCSCRSIPEFHITQALDQCGDLLEYYGGHAAAAGFTVRNENLNELVDRLGIIAEEQLSGVDLRPSLSVDVEIPLSDLNPHILRYLNQLQPTGYGNPEAVFVSRDLKVLRKRTVGRDNTHLKMSVSDGRITFDAIAFKLGHWYNQLNDRIDLAYTFELNSYKGTERLQLNVQDIKRSDR